MKLSLRSLLYDLMFYEKCPVCSKNSYWQYAPFCLNCWLSISPLESFKITAGGFPREFWRYVDSLYSFAIYDGIVREVIHYFKYQKIKRLGKHLGRLLSKINPPQIDVLIPVPLHGIKLRQREFNQSAILADELSKSWNIPLILDGLIKVKHTKDQAMLEAEERKDNLKNAFIVVKDMTDLEIGLVDDVVTTGSTLRECAKVLKEAKAKSIHAITLARAH